MECEENSAVTHAPAQANLQSRLTAKKKILEVCCGYQQAAASPLTRFCFFCSSSKYPRTSSSATSNAVWPCSRVAEGRNKKMRSRPKHGCERRVFQSRPVTHHLVDEVHVTLILHQYPTRLLLAPVCGRVQGGPAVVVLDVHFIACLD